MKRPPLNDAAPLPGGAGVTIADSHPKSTQRSPEWTRALLAAFARRGWCRADILETSATVDAILRHGRAWGGMRR